MSQSLPLVTIAIPTYNRAATYLPQAFQSALEQTYPNIEIIVADNGSSDGTRELIESYRDPRVRYYRQDTNIAPNDNFNFCLRLARGEYFQLLLDDEQIDRNFVEVCLRAAKMRPTAGLIRTGLRAIDENNVVVEEMSNHVNGGDLADLILAWFDNRTALYLCNSLFNRVQLLTLGGFRSRCNLFQDVIAQVRIAANSPRVEVADIKATTRRHRAQHTYSAKVKEWCIDSLDLLELINLETPDRHELLQKRGRRFFANICYRRANAIRPLRPRLQAYWDVYRSFGYRVMPPLRAFASSTQAYRSLRRVKRQLLHRPAWVD